MFHQLYPVLREVITFWALTNHLLNLVAFLYELFT